MNQMNDNSLLFRLPKSMLDGIDTAIASLKDRRADLDELTRSSFTRWRLAYVPDQLDGEDTAFRLEVTAV